MENENNKVKKKVDPNKWAESFFSKCNKEENKEEKVLVNFDEDLFLSMVKPSGFYKIPIFYKYIRNDDIDKKWKDLRGILTRDYIKKSKLAQRQGKKNL
ncbi:uncharacterized protein CMU_012270 [Cryptosporidium muris RN66]|uniref:Uncharacterized protein n=1 Tax=Cryptosporidium muris (strain RN66) TaxID=441375 RepID=B6AED6_CRYMR|nr:uncharacterized protein CMU_012270 [Cryptosporidium muris RN66]EEA06553.1 hypothetical protein, conserved [Cryptosporidium muris RN66]|eukprot:XP_002140902.1 hypothetical protein [Cryptosporidium muris RN66]